MEDYHRSNLVIYMGDKAIELLTWICKKEKRMNGEVLPNRILTEPFSYMQPYSLNCGIVYFLHQF